MAQSVSASWLTVKNSMKWLLGLLAGAVFALSLIGISVWLIGLETSNWFPLNRLEVKGQEYTQAQELYQTFQAIEDRGFFSMNIEQAEADILALPWVKKVQLRKVWPETLNLQIEEHEPLAYWGANGVVSTQGHVFYPNELPQENWLVLSGPETMAAELTDLLQDYQQQLDQKQLRIESMQLTDRGAVSLELNDGVIVKLGKIQVAERLQRLIEQFDLVKQYKKAPLAYLDLRYQNGLVASWQEPALPSDTKQ